MTDALEFKYRSLNHGENKAFELNELLSMFAPKWCAAAYEVSLSLLIYLALFGFAAVFGNSMCAKLPVLSWGSDCSQKWSSGCEHSFLLWVGLFMFIVVFIALRDVTEMLEFQMVLTAARFLLVGTLVLVSIGGLAADPAVSTTALALQSWA